MSELSQERGAELIEMFSKHLDSRSYRMTVGTQDALDVIVALKAGVAMTTQTKETRVAMTTRVELPIRRDVPLTDQCGHGKLWIETCAECRIVSLQESLKWMEPQVKRDRAELELLLGEAPSTQCTRCGLNHGACMC